MPGASLEDRRRHVSGQWIAPRRGTCRRGPSVCRRRRQRGCPRQLKAQRLSRSRSTAYRLVVWYQRGCIYQQGHFPKPSPQSARSLERERASMESHRHSHHGASVVLQKNGVFGAKIARSQLCKPMGHRALMNFFPGLITLLAVETALVCGSRIRFLRSCDLEP